MPLLRRVVLSALLCSASALAACSSDYTPTPDPGDVTPPATQPAGTAGNEDTTFDHDNSADVDPWALLEQREEEGPPEFSSRLHSCPKIRYRTIGNVLASRGVDLDAQGGTAAGNIYRNADQALGVANYAARVPETTELTTASAAKLFDIWVAAAPEIIANMPARAECTVGGVGAQMFNAQGQCTLDGISCLIGLPATATHVELCNQIVASASSPDTGRIIAVAALAAAAHTCE
jgi:hypothetical protein